MVDIVCIDFYSLDDVIWIDDECFVVSKIRFFVKNIEVVRDCLRWVIDYCVSDFVDFFRVVMLVFVYEVSICRDRVYFNI